MAPRLPYPKEWVYEQYVVNGLSSTDIAEITDKDPSTVIHWLKRYNIPRRNVGAMSKQRVNRNRVKCICETCGDTFMKSPARAGRREHHFCSERCSQKWHTMENNSQWKGFRVDQLGRVSWEYRKWRNDVIKRDRYTCVNCGSKNKLHVHHIKPYAKFEELRVDISNGITLCQKCHYEEHRNMQDEDMV